MSKETIPARTLTKCDRCRVVLDEENSKDNREWMTKAVQHRFIRKGVVARLGRFVGLGRPSPIVAEIHLCDGCWWEFDLLFLQGLAVNPINGIRQYAPPSQYGRRAVEGAQQHG